MRWRGRAPVSWRLMLLLWMFSTALKSKVSSLSIAATNLRKQRVGESEIQVKAQKSDGLL